MLTEFRERWAGLNVKAEQFGPHFLPPWVRFPEV
jgi:hypothetical protein